MRMFDCVLLVGCSSLVLFALIGSSEAYITTSAEDLRMRNYAFMFEEYMAEYGKSYGADEIEMRRALFERRLAEVREHNEDPVRSRLWKKGLNSHTDRTEAELRMLRGYDRAHGHERRRSMSGAQRAPDVSRRGDLPASLDWRQVPGVVTSVKDQGNCGSCWAFAATATIESHWAIATGRVADLSVQSIVSCAENPRHCGGTGGCNGGTPDVAFDYAREFGLASEWEYGYRQYFNNVTEVCPGESLPSPVAVVKSIVDVASNSLEGVMEALQVGPLAIIVDATYWSSYESGIYSGCDPQERSSLDHAVVLVGYGSELLWDNTEQPYWIIRNSWGVDYGENGYIRITREIGNPRCGTDPYNGTACGNLTPGPVTVCGACGMLYDVSYPIVASWDKMSDVHDI